MLDRKSSMENDMLKSNSINFNQKSFAALRPYKKSLATLGLTADKNGKVDLFDAQMPGLALRPGFPRHITMNVKKAIFHKNFWQFKRLVMF